MSETLWQCTLYDQFTDYPYADTRVYRTREEAEKRAERMTSTEDGIEYWATVHPVKACWKEEEMSERIICNDNGGELREVIVRCKDCKRFAVDQSDHEYRSGWWCHRWNTDMVKPDGFCAWGVRS